MTTPPTADGSLRLSAASPYIVSTIEGATPYRPRYLNLHGLWTDDFATARRFPNYASAALAALHSRGRVLWVAVAELRAPP